MNSQTAGDFNILRSHVGIETRTAAGRLMFNIMASSAEWERDLTAEHTKTGMQAKMTDGVFMGGLPVITPEIWDFCIAELAEDDKLSPLRLAEKVENKYNGKNQLRRFLQIARRHGGEKALS